MLVAGKRYRIVFHNGRSIEAVYIGKRRHGKIVPVSLKREDPYFKGIELHESADEHYAFELDGADLSHPHLSHLIAQVHTGQNLKGEHQFSRMLFLPFEFRLEGVTVTEVA